MNVRAWLRKNPQPSRMRVDGKDVALPDGKHRWAEAERTLATLQAQKVEALDANGVVLRACDLAEDGEASDAEKEKPPNGMCPHCGMNLVFIARELRLASDESSARHEAGYRYAFDAISAMFTEQSRRLAGLETAWQKLVLAAGAPSGDDESVMGALLQGMIAGKRDAAAEKTNGKK